MKRSKASVHFCYLRIWVSTIETENFRETIPLPELILEEPGSTISSMEEIYPPKLTLK